MGRGGKFCSLLQFCSTIFFHLNFWLQTDDRISRASGLLKVFR